MKRIFRNTTLASASLIGSRAGIAVVFVLSGCSSPAPDELRFQGPTLDVAPWTHLRFPAERGVVRFAIVGDRSAIPRPEVFDYAVSSLSALQPDFVMSVGDLISGYTFDGRVTDAAELDRTWSEVNNSLGRLSVPFFATPGNNDVSGPDMIPRWEQRFGVRHYSFRYGDFLFVVLNSDDPPGTDPGGVSPEQVSWFTHALASEVDVSWTFVFLHRPLWNSDPVWAEIEKALEPRRHTVFAGHFHRFSYELRGGAEYYMLATTGGLSDLTGVSDGQFDHVTWVSAAPGEEPKVAHLLLDGILDSTTGSSP